MEEPKTALRVQEFVEPTPEFLEPRAAIPVEEAAEKEDDDTPNIKEVKNDKNMSIQNVAAMLQAEREKEDEKNNPNPQLKK